MISVVQVIDIGSKLPLLGRIATACYVFLALSLLVLSPVFACKYTVRDVAFVEMGYSQHRLYLYFDADTPDDEATLLRTSAEHALADSNVNLQVVIIGETASDEALSHLDTFGIDEYSSAVLVSPRGTAKQILLPTQNERNAGNVRQAMDSIVRSPRRKELLSKLSTAHSVVLIIESENKVQNEYAKAMAESAIERIVATFPNLPKPIDGPPLIISISAEEAQKESILLWNLGVDIEAQYSTQIAMVFGRGRILGSVFDVGEINEQDLLRTLAVVGLDCECELDRSWMQTPMFPHVWTEVDESMAATALGFDPGHPLVKVEISRILSRGPSSQGRGPTLAPETLLPGLQIIELNFEDDEADLVTAKAAEVYGDGRKTSPSASNTPESEQVRKDSAGRADMSGTVTAVETAVDPRRAEDSTKSFSFSRIISTTLLGLAVLGLIGGAFVVFCGKRNGP